MFDKSLEQIEHLRYRSIGALYKHPRHLIPDNALLRNATQVEEHLRVMAESAAITIKLIKGVTLSEQDGKKKIFNLQTDDISRYYGGTSDPMEIRLIRGFKMKENILIFNEFGRDYEIPIQAILSVEKAVAKQVDT